ncbi:sensor domain-containing phosphodiesterase [Noviherbaspirillum malthae]|uniref:sensor domain-containing phosphodiesterase n=1 Tax=Noviherbaspirillum malthae TaxID=1260987 RepID=UPI001E39F90A|nr:EAL domain-containing protein [Noviherbaspirillum malthae]
MSELLLEGVTSESKPYQDSLLQMLAAIRRHLKMDVAFISEFSEGKRVFRQVDPQTADNPVQPGAGDPLEASFCQRVVDGRLPELIPDARLNPVAAALPPTHALPVGAHLSVPIRMQDGSVYGTFCCFSRAADNSLDERDLNMMRVFADVAGELIERERMQARRREEITLRLRPALEDDGLAIVYQPIYDLVQHKVVGFEALSRFVKGPERSPDVWFSEANEIGLGGRLEAHAVRMSLEGLRDLPADIYVSVNMSPEHILEGTMDQFFQGKALHRVMLEITEHAVVEHYDELVRKIRPYRDRGLKVAVDDAGAGYSSFRHILHLMPDRIKLDMSLTRNIDGDTSRRALAAAFARFSEETGSAIVAEGVETAAEMHTLQALGVTRIQGFYIGRPVALPAAIQLCSADPANGMGKLH